jgi:hypothetical protein
MVFNREAFGGQPRHVSRAGVHVKNPLALRALKVVMVLVPGDFKARVVSRQAHLLQDFFFHQRFDVPVDGRNAHAWNLSLSCVQHFLR